MGMLIDSARWFLLILPRPLTLQESIDREPRFKEETKNNPKVKKLLELSLKLEGLNRNMATHAAGVVIAGDKLAEQFPFI